jgi:hypothetical protein
MPITLFRLSTKTLFHPQRSSPLGMDAELYALPEEPRAPLVLC